MKTQTLLHESIYSVAEAARLVGMTANRVRRWMYGYEYEWGTEGGRRRGKQPPVVVRGRSGETRMASFLDLMELLYAKSFLDCGISLRKVRKALSEAKGYIREDHPFARQQFYALGKDIFLELKGRHDSDLLGLLQGGQLGLRSIIVGHGKKIDFDRGSGLATAWWPMGREKPVVVTPTVAFGAPSIEGRGVKTANIYDLYRAENEDVKSVCHWLSLKPAEVHAAVEYEQTLRAHAA